MHIRGRTLTTLEKSDWGPPPGTSRLVDECHRLRHVPLGDLTVEDLRLLIGQSIGLRWLMPLALERLERDPFVEGDLYPGDLLAACLSCDEAYWASAGDERDRLLAVVRRARGIVAGGERAEELLIDDFDSRFRQQLPVFARSGPVT